MIKYDNFFKTLKARGLTTYTLIHKYQISSSQINRLKHNKGISTNTIDTLCKILDCQVSDIIEYVADDQNSFE